MDRSSRPACIAWAVTTLVFAAAVTVTASRLGPWLDEYWSVFLGDPHLPISELFHSRWVFDPHPVPANFLYTVTAAVAQTTRVSELRLWLNMAALVFLTASTLLFLKGSKVRASFYPLSALLLLGSLPVISYATEYRAYFCLMAMALVGLQYFHWALSEQPSRFDVRDVVGSFATLASLNLHFVGSLLIAPAYILLIWTGLRVGARGRLAWLCVLINGSLALALTWALLQYSRFSSVADVHWVTTSTRQAADIYLQTLKDFALSFGVFAILVALCMIWSRRSGRQSFDPRRLRISLAIAASGLLGALALLVLNAVQPVIVDRYLCVWYPMAAAAIAILAADAPRGRGAIAVCAAASALVVIAAQAKHEASRADWGTGLADIRAVLARCPETQVFAAPNWRFTNFSGTLTATRETLVLHRGVELFAMERHLPLHTWDSTSPVSLRLGRCPALVWIPHIWGVVAIANDPYAVLRAGHIAVPPGAEVSKLPSDNLILRIDGRDQ